MSDPVRSSPFPPGWASANTASNTKSVLPRVSGKQGCFALLGTIAKSKAEEQWTSGRFSLFKAARIPCSVFSGKLEWGWWHPLGLSCPQQVSSWMPLFMSAWNTAHYWFIDTEFAVWFMPKWSLPNKPWVLDLELRTHFSRKVNSHVGSSVGSKDRLYQKQAEFCICLTLALAFSCWYGPVWLGLLLPPRTPCYYCNCGSCYFPKHLVLRQWKGSRRQECSCSVWVARHLARLQSEVCSKITFRSATCMLIVSATLPCVRKWHNV